MSDTKEKILNAAERLFAHNGFHCTSLRQITNEAAVNLAAVNYHFGSKEALIDAVLARRLEPLNRERCRRLEVNREVAADKGGALSCEAVMRAFLEPAMELSRPGVGAENFLVLVGRGLAAPEGVVGNSFFRLMRDTAGIFFQALCQALPEKDPEVVFWRMHFAIGAMAHTMRWAGRFESMAPEGLAPRGDNDQLIERLLSFILAGMESA